MSYPKKALTYSAHEPSSIAFWASFRRTGHASAVPSAVEMLRHI